MLAYETIELESDIEADARMNGLASDFIQSSRITRRMIRAAKKYNPIGDERANGKILKQINIYAEQLDRLYYENIQLPYAREIGSSIEFLQKLDLFKVEMELLSVLEGSDMLYGEKLEDLVEGLRILDEDFPV